MIEKLRYQPGLGNLLNATLAEAETYARFAAGVVDSFTEADNGLAILCERIGNYHTTTGNLQKALAFFEQFSALEKELYDADPNNVAFKNGLAISYIKLGLIHGKMKNSAKVLHYYQLSTKLLAQLVRDFPDYVEFKRNLEWVERQLAEK